MITNGCQSFRWGGQLDTVCKQIGLNVEAQKLALSERANRVQNTNNENFGEAKTSRKYSRADHQTRIDRWKENLSMEEIKSVTPMLERTAKLFDYSLN